MNKKESIDMKIASSPKTLCRRLEAKAALVTGAGQGIGRAIAVRLAAEGAFVGILDWNSDTAQETVEMIQSAGGLGMALHADVSEPSQVISCVEKIKADQGKIDLLVNNAGLDRPGGFLKLDYDSFSDVFNIHVLGTVNCVRTCLPCMLDQGDGRIVNVSSIYGKVGTKGESPYCCAKAGIVGLTKSLAKEFGGKGIRVNAVMPGLTNTPTIKQMMHPKYQEAFVRETPLARIADPDEIARPVAFLLSDEASYITGAVLEVTGGWGM
jgi:NAD(P)-dependent dehydrogenase (short-subunit alcohol dehydrogenase family)